MSIQLDIWSIDLSAAINIDQMMQGLSIEEQTHCRRLITEDLRRKYCIVHYAKRKILSNYLQRSPEDIVFSAGPFGKPYVEEAAWQFNLSHSGDLCLLGIVKEVALGIDVEKKTRELDLVEIAERFFTKNESDYIAEQKNKREAFFSIWVRKEAVLKCLGVGLSGSLKAFDVLSSSSDEQFSINWLDRENLYLPIYTARHCAVPEEYFAAFVVNAVDISVRRFDYQMNLLT